MSIIESHRKKPRGHGLPEVSVAQKQFDLGHGDVGRLSLNINKKNIIEELAYQISDESWWLPYFSIITELVEGLNFEEAYLLSWQSIIEYIEAEDDREFTDKEKLELPVECLPVKVLHEALDEYCRPAHLASLSFININDLVCRCFGVTREKILELVKKSNVRNVLEVTKSLKAGGLCGSCQEDIAEILYLNSDKEDYEWWKLLGVNYHGLNPIEAIFKLDEIIQGWERKNFKVAERIVNIVDLWQDQLVLTTSSKYAIPPEALHDLENVLRLEFPVTLFLFFD